MNEFIKEGGTLMDKILTKAIWEIRRQDNCEQGKEINVTIIPSGGKSYQIYFPTGGCRYACIMCNYGFCHPIREKEILQELDEICNNLPKDCEIIILEASGSFLDGSELPTHIQDKIMERMAKASDPVQMIQMETHYTTITKKKIQRIKSIFTQKDLSFELGLESTNPEVIKIYNKAMNLEELLDVILLSEEEEIGVSLNLMVGAPLLTIQEQVQDALDSVDWILKNCPKSTHIVLFPLNIKDYTLVKHMYNQGRYSVLYDWEFIEVLAKIPQEELDRVHISWWGNRCNEFHGEEAIIKPFHCNECHNELQIFYRNFVESTQKSEKAKLIEGIVSHNCRCKEAYLKLKETQEKPKLSYSERLEEEKLRLISELNL